MSNYPNYRVSVELILKHGEKVFLAKRASHCAVAPGVWCVPAGKVKYEEIPINAAVREFKEEADIDVYVKAELSCRAAKIKVNEEDAFRLFFTYLVEPYSEDSINSIKLNDEHSEYVWADRNDLVSEKFSSLHEDLRNIILEKVLI